MDNVFKPRNKHLNDVLRSKRGGAHVKTSKQKRAQEKRVARRNIEDFSLFN